MGLEPTQSTDSGPTVSSGMMDAAGVASAGGTWKPDSSGPHAEIFSIPLRARDCRDAAGSSGRLQTFTLEYTAHTSDTFFKDESARSLAELRD